MTAAASGTRVTSWPSLKTAWVLWESVVPEFPSGTLPSTSTATERLDMKPSDATVASPNLRPGRPEKSSAGALCATATVLVTRCPRNTGLANNFGHGYRRRFGTTPEPVNLNEAPLRGIY